MFRDPKMSSASSAASAAARGAFILFEGVDRCGKTTQATKLVEALKAAGQNAVLMRFPGAWCNEFESCATLLVVVVVDFWRSNTFSFVFPLLRAPQTGRLPLAASSTSTSRSRWSSTTGRYTSSSARTGGNEGEERYR